MNEQKRRRVAITGVGMVTPVGNDTPSTWARILDGSSGVAPIESFDSSGFPTRIAAEVKGLVAEDRIDDRKILKYVESFAAFALSQENGQQRNGEQATNRSQHSGKRPTNRSQHSDMGATKRSHHDPSVKSESTNRPASLRPDRP